MDGHRDPRRWYRRLPRWDCSFRSSLEEAIALWLLQLLLLQGEEDEEDDDNLDCPLGYTNFLPFMVCRELVGTIVVGPPWMLLLQAVIVG